VKIITTLGFIFAALGWLWLAIRYFGKGDTIGGIIFLVTAILSAILFLRQLTEKKKV
jgi:hypothetical protein